MDVSFDKDITPQAKSVPSAVVEIRVPNWPIKSARVHWLSDESVIFRDHAFIELTCESSIEDYTGVFELRSPETGRLEKASNGDVVQPGELLATIHMQPTAVVDHGHGEPSTRTA